MTDNKRIAFLGGGNMAEAIIKGLLRDDSTSALWKTAPRQRPGEM
jgi:pyrroline-5-carboxylate reductase